MRISYNWLQDYFEEKLPVPEHIGALITMHSFEVDGIEEKGNDTIFDFKILPDRAHDAMSHYGIAREIGILLNIKPKNLDIEVRTDGFSTRNFVTVTIEDESRAKRAMKRVVKNITVGESPAWLKTRLESIGQRSINNVVDVANFVMFETGQPVHTFDFEKLYGDIKHISVRNAMNGEKLTALDGKTYELNEDILVIADEKNALDIAGIKGGMASGIDEKTTNVLLSVCNFNPTMIRKTRTKLGLRTDASDRFERGLSSKLPKLALLRLSYLLQQVAGGDISEDYVDIYPQPEDMRHVIVSLREINHLLGLELSEDGLEGLFRKLQFGTEKISHSTYRVDIPTNRLDISIPADIAEEIIRILGYERLPATVPKIEKKPQINAMYHKMLFVRDDLLKKGYSEVYTYAFRDTGDIEVLKSASNKKFLRKDLTSGLKESIELNQKNLPLLDVREVKVFEIGTVFTSDGEKIHVAFGDKKNITEMTLDEYVTNNKLEIGDYSEYQSLLQPPPSNLQPKTFKPWSQYPFIVRDIALWVPEDIDRSEVSDVIKENAGELLMKGPTLFDQFQKESRKSYGFRLVFQSMDRTLTDEEVNKIMEKINKILIESGWEVR